MSTECGVLIGFFASIIASILVWFGLNRLVVPKIQLSDDIICQDPLVNKGKKTYKVTITNLSVTEAIDVKLHGRLVLFNLNARNTDEPFLYVANIGTGQHPYLPKRNQKNKAVIDNQRKFLVRPSKKAKTQLAKLYGLEEADTNIETILRADNRNYLEIVVTCTHSWSSARKITRKRYNKDHIRNSNSQGLSNNNIINAEIDTDDYED